MSNFYLNFKINKTKKESTLRGLVQKWILPKNHLYLSVRERTVQLFSNTMFDYLINLLRLKMLQKRLHKIPLNQLIF